MPGRSRAAAAMLTFIALTPLVFAHRCRHRAGPASLMIRRTLAVALFGCIAATAVEAQDTSGRARFWAAAGVGAGLPTSGGDGIANMAQLVFESDPHHVALRALVLHDLDRNTNEVGEVGALYGRTLVFGRLRGAVAAGISGVAFDRCPDDDDGCFDLGLPLVAEAALSGRFAGVGVQAFGNLNPEASYAGAVLFLQLGRL